MQRTCKKCGEEFELLPNKPGFANVCPTCTESSEESAKRAEEQENLRKSLIAASKEQTRRLEEAELEKLKKEALGLKKIPGTSFAGAIPIGGKRGKRASSGKKPRKK